MTAYTGPTPYDAEIAVMRKEDPRGTWIRLPRLEAKGEGYRRAKAEDAPLLEAAKAAYVNLAHWQDAEQWDDEDDVTLIRLAEAIAQAQGKE